MKVSKQMLWYEKKLELSTLYCTSFLVTDNEDEDEDRKPPAKCAKMSKLDGPAAEITGTPTALKPAATKHPWLVTDIKRASPADMSVLAPTPPITQPPSPYEYKIPQNSWMAPQLPNLVDCQPIKQEEDNGKFKCESTFTQTRITNKQFLFVLT
jgi:hypothetical protein